MSEVLVGGAAWWAIPSFALVFGVVFGFFPGFVLRLLVLLYPADDPRRRELVAELYVLGRMERVEWVFQQLETALFEGVAARLERRRAADEEPADEETGEESPGVDGLADARQRPRPVAEAIAVGGGSGPWPFTPARIGMTDVRQVEASTSALRSLDHEHGAAFCRDAVVAQLSWGQRMLDSSGTDVVKQRLRVALAGLHNLAGWTSFDVGLIDSARDHFRQALTLVENRGADELVSNILYRLGRTYVHEHQLRDALRAYELGWIAAHRHGCDLATAIIDANQAWVHRLLDEQEQALRLTVRARDAFARVDDDAAAPWLTRFDDHPAADSRGHRRGDVRYRTFIRSILVSARSTAV
jgi:tetratricopeptide (TPR) repeat protein